MNTRKAKNNNLDIYKEKVASTNKALVKKAIAHIVDLSGEITFSSVSKVTYEVADIQKKQKGLTVAGISTSSIYRALVENAKANQDVGTDNRRRAKVKNYSSGDLGLMIHSLRVENASLKQNNKILTSASREVEREIETVEPISEKIIKKGNALQDVSRSIVNRLCELELGYIDTQNNLRLQGYEYILVHKEALELFYKKELDDIKSKIRQTAANAEP